MAVSTSWAVQNSRGLWGIHSGQMCKLAQPVPRKSVIRRICACIPHDFPAHPRGQTLTSRIFTGSMLKRSSLSKTMSASLPGVIEPLSFS